MIDHLTVSVADLAASTAFYEKALAPLGYSVQMHFGEFCGLGPPHKPAFWLKQATPTTTPQHIAFVATSRGAVDSFYQAAIAAGARDNGRPGLRADYHPNYYGAFVIDPLNGHPIEAVCHAPVVAKKKAAKRAAKKPTKKATTKKARR